MKEDNLNYCKKHHTTYVTECHSCYREATKCIHGVPFDSECGECIEDAQIVKAGKERSNYEKLSDNKIDNFLKQNDTIEAIIEKFQENLDTSKFQHHLKNPNSRYYELWEDVETIDIIESILTAEELIGACKFNILKYQLRLGKKDDIEKERVKIKTYQDYLRYLYGK